MEIAGYRSNGSNGPPRMPLNLAIVGDFFISRVTRRTNFIVALEMSKRRWKYHHVSTWVAREATTIAVVSNSTRQELSSAAVEKTCSMSRSHKTLIFVYCFNYEWWNVAEKPIAMMCLAGDERRERLKTQDSNAVIKQSNLVFNYGILMCLGSLCLLFLCISREMTFVI